MGKQTDTELALIDTGVDVNAISYKTWDSLGQPQFKHSTLAIDAIMRQSTLVEGELELPIFIGTTDVHAYFVAMKLGVMDALIILGQPWQRQYNAVPNWR